MKRLNSAELRAFMVDQTLHVFDPDSHAHVATVTYGEDSCLAQFADGTEDRGQFGLSRDTYWTRYTRFRAGETNHFYLVQIAPQIVQAYHTDGRRAFLQSPLTLLEKDAT